MERSTSKLTTGIWVQIKHNKSLGPCTVPAWAIKDGMFIIAPHLTYVYNECLKNSVFPDQLKLANVTPIFKKDDPLDVINYRPISITNSFSKLFEKILHEQISNYLSKHSIMNPNQSGFRKNFFCKRCSTSTYGVHSQTNRWKKIVHAALLDLSKVFDSHFSQQTFGETLFNRLQPNSSWLSWELFDWQIPTSLHQWCILKLVQSKTGCAPGNCARSTSFQFIC